MKQIFTILTALVLIGCSTQVSTNKSITVSIEPLAWIATSLVDSGVVVEVLVPAGSSPETYEPTTRQSTQLSQSALYLSTGLLDFEMELASRLSSIAAHTQMVNLSDSVDVMTGSCSHIEHEGHSNGVDPHIWLAPRSMRMMIAQTATAIIENGLSDSARVVARRDSLFAMVDSIDHYISGKAAAETRSFAIVHPSLSYYARDYGLHQIALEIDGKEPSAADIRSIIDELRKDQISTIFYGIQTSDATAKVVANEIGCSLWSFDPLAFDWPSSIIEITDRIYGTH